MTGKRVLIVDDSALARRMVRRVVETLGDVAEISEARDGRDAVQKAARLEPDVITLDVEMPGIDGVEVLRTVMRTTPCPVIMVAAGTSHDADLTMECLAQGAFDFVKKPSSGERASLFDLRLRNTIKGALRSRRRAAPATPATRVETSGPPPGLVVVASSTGGPPTLERLLSRIPATVPFPIVVVQHMPSRFTASLASRLDGFTDLTVREADDGATLRAGRVLVAAGGYHLVVTPTRARLDDAPPVNGLRPWADFTFRSAAQAFGAGVLGIVLTGMGKDGLEGSRAIKESGGRVWAQDGGSAAVDGMPSAVRKAGLADGIGTPESLGAGIAAWAAQSVPT